MRLALVALLTATACVPTVGRPGAEAEEGVRRPRTPDIDAARDLDQQGVRAFREARWADALRYFRASYRLGGPSSEVWNIARCRERLDDAEGAAAAIDQYLALRDLSPQDRAEAEREVQGLRARGSTLTVTTNPAGAVLTIDGRQTAGPTPVSVEVLPGPASRSTGTVMRPRPARWRRASGGPSS